MINLDQYYSEVTQGYEFENSNSNSNTPLPEGEYNAYIEKVECKEWQDEKYLNATWNITGPKYIGRKVFHKIKINNAKPETATRHRKILVAIDTLTGGVMRTKLQTNPNMEDVSNFISFNSKPLNIKVAIWEVNGNEGNWIQGVKPFAPMQAQTTASPIVSNNNDNDIPF